MSFELRLQSGFGIALNYALSTGLLLDHRFQLWSQLRSFSPLSSSFRFHQFEIFVFGSQSCTYSVQNGATVTLDLCSVYFEFRVPTPEQLWHCVKFLSGELLLLFDVQL